MNEQKPPLFDLFIGLREEAGLPLTIDQYDMLLQALEGGFGIASREELKQICRLLWIKSKSSLQAERFEQYFEQYFERFDFQPEKETPRTTIPSNTPVGAKNHSSPQPDTQILDTPHPSVGGVSQIPSAMRGELLPEQPFRESRYQLSVRDFPVTRRQIQQNWRYLRRPIREGALTEVDIEATLQKISQDGVFLEPVLMKSRINRAELLLLIDASNSMVPFHLLSQRLVDNLQGGRLGKADIYYFRNCPRDYLYLHSHRPDALAINDLLPKLHCQRTVVLIVSDGGAARGGINRDRIKLTREFLDRFTPYVRHLAWLNPMPEERWQDTTAQAISQLVQMFELNYQGFKAAI
ncbi:hypothetical protein [Iningainema tapete]|uniref:VWA containing CoxE family protein n=1 Tax=Iningainema tapete BLCC-T55 TaxID=2748662 RepID=A0A8J6XD74_9CYAN|nr:hypothetical protein [Iningainema tapete]MBD2773735.1 hypothetical protein [Iningainema tapete BLCC-T55]